MYIKVYQSYRKLSTGTDMQSMALIQLTCMNFEFSSVKAGLRKNQNICETKYPLSRNSLPIYVYQLMINSAYILVLNLLN